MRSCLHRGLTAVRAATGQTWRRVHIAGVRRMHIAGVCTARGYMGTALWRARACTVHGRGDGAVELAVHEVAVSRC